MKIKQQQSKGLEKYVDLECDLHVNKNIQPINDIVSKLAKYHSDIDLNYLFNKIIKTHFNTGAAPVHINQLAVVNTKASISITDPAGLRADKLFTEYSKYSDNFDTNCDPVVLLHPSIFSDVTPEIDALFNLDGMHRVVSAAVAGVGTIDVQVIVRRKDLRKLITQKQINDIKHTRSACSWFPSYQQINEVGIDGQRVQYPRYPDIYDFSVLEDQTVVDFGGNTGQACVEAYFNGAKQLYNLDVQQCAVNTANQIFDTLGMCNASSHVIDFNKPTFEEDVLKICNGWDWCIFQAIYRTKEIIDIKSNFKFIVNNTKKGIMFEGNGEPTIDTDEFYFSIFEEFNFKKVIPRGLCQKRPVYIIYK